MQQVYKKFKSAFKRFGRGAVRTVQGAYDINDSLVRSSAPSATLHRLGIARLDFFRKRIPEGDRYAFEVHYPPELDGELKGFEEFHLVGRAWKQTPEAPIAVCFGFNDWKYGFVADYCPQYRMVFAPRSFMGPRARWLLRQMRPVPKAVYVWGYTTPSWVQEFAERRKIPFTRVEDGFLRSADLGARHATPYSLVFDKSGLFYNTSEPNDLAKLLQTTTFSRQHDLMREARECLDLLQTFKLSKYNPPEPAVGLAPVPVKTRHRVLVVGQVDNDAAIRMGNPEGWSMIDIVRLAKLENPRSEILYRPHPEVYRGHQRTRFRGRSVEKFARIIAPVGPLTQLLETVDHVYTISSLSGLEAVMLGKKVTTLGTPFYAGYGLTDDRVKKAAKRKLTKTELFAGVYLLYPRYLAALDDPATGFKAAAWRIKADRTLLTCGYEQDGRPSGLDKTWLQQIFDERESQPVVVNHYPAIRDYLMRLRSSTVQVVLCLAAMENMESDVERFEFLNQVGDTLTPRAFSDILLLVTRPSQKPTIFVPLYNALLKKTDPTLDARDLLAWQEMISKQRMPDADFAVENDVQPPQDEKAVANAQRLVQAKADAEFRAGHWDQSIRTTQAGLSEFGIQSPLLLHLLTVLVDRFQFDAAQELAHLYLASGRSALFAKSLTALTVSSPGLSDADTAELANLYIAAMPEKIINADLLAGRLEPMSEGIALQSLFRKQADLASQFSVRRVQALLGLERPEDALELARILAREHPDRPNVLVVYSQALTACGLLDEAISLMNEVFRTHRTELVLREMLRLCVLSNDDTRGVALLEDAQRRRIDVGDMLPRKIFFIARDPGTALATFQNLNIRKEISRTYSEKYCLDLLTAAPGRRVFIAAIFGPGDELRWACMYENLTSLLPHDDIRIGCEPRLFDLFERSFPQTTFVPVKRVRNLAPYDVENYDKVRSSSLITVLDNEGHEEILASDDFVLASDLPAYSLRGYEDFSGTPYLVPDPKKQENLRERFPNSVPLVGISWRSSVTTHSRNEHYLTVQELEPIFKIKGIQFVNFQYDECSEELAWVEQRYPGRIIDLEDVDHYNDLDQVAAMLSVMDLVISPGTTVVELAGAVGVPTWLLSNSVELNWRKREGSNVDVWHNSIEHLEGDVLGDKKALVNTLRDELVGWRKRTTGKAGPVRGRFTATKKRARAAMRDR